MHFLIYAFQLCKAKSPDLLHAVSTAAATDDTQTSEYRTVLPFILIPAYAEIWPKKKALQTTADNSLLSFEKNLYIAHT